MNSNEKRLTIRLPKAATDFLKKAATENFTSTNAEIVRAVRQMMEGETQPSKK